MTAQTARWQQFGAWIALTLVVSSACTLTAGGPTSARTAPAVQTATSNTQAATASQPAANTQPVPATHPAASDSPKPVEWNAAVCGTAAGTVKLDSCTLVSTSDMAAVVGTLQPGPTRVLGSYGDVIDCTYQTAAGQEIGVQLDDAARWTYDQKLALRDPKAHKVVGIGDDAFWSSGADAGSEMKVLTGAYILTIRVGMDDAKHLDIAKALATRALVAHMWETATRRHRSGRR